MDPVSVIIANGISILIAFAIGWFTSPAEVKEKIVYKELYTNAEIAKLTIFGECAKGKISKPVNVGDVNVIVIDDEITIDLKNYDGQSILLQPTQGREPNAFKYGRGALINPDDIELTLLNYKDCSAIATNYQKQAIGLNTMLEKQASENNTTKKLIDNQGAH